MITAASLATITNTTFVDNHAERGGALALVSTASASRGSGRTDVYALTQPPSVAAAGNTYERNVADTSGGAVDAIGTDALRATLDFKEDTFVANEATGGGNGGALSVDKSVLTISESVLLDGRAGDGGALRATTSTVSVNASTVRSNKASERGGAVSAVTSTLLVYDCAVSDNAVTAGAEGGGAGALTSLALALVMSRDRAVFVGLKQHKSY